MRKLTVALVAVLSLVGASAMALTLAKTRTWAAQTIPNGDNVLPANGLNMPVKPSFAEVSLTRDNWPAQGVDLTIELSYDAGATWVVCAGPQHIDPGVFDPKLGAIAPAKIGCGWNADRFAGPDLGRLRAVNPAAGFTADIELDFYTDK